MSHKFGREFQRGISPWIEHPTEPGKFIGNPSVSHRVSQYMISLRRRKVMFALAVGMTVQANIISL